MFVIPNQVLKQVQDDFSLIARVIFVQFFLLKGSSAFRLLPSALCLLPSAFYDLMLSTYFPSPEEV
jgi:hypothetical protein